MLPIIITICNFLLIQATHSDSNIQVNHLNQLQDDSIGSQNDLGLDEMWNRAKLFELLTNQDISKTIIFKDLITQTLIISFIIVYAKRIQNNVLNNNSRSLQSQALIISFICIFTLTSANVCDYQVIQEPIKNVQITQKIQTEEGFYNIPPLFSDYNDCSIDYSVTIQELGEENFISFDANLLQIKWKSPQISGIYIIIVQGTLNTEVNQFQHFLLFKLIINQNRQLAEAIKSVTASTIDDQQYTVGSNYNYAVYFSEFTASGLGCYANQTQYSMAVTSDNSQNKTFIILQQFSNSRSVQYKTSTQLQIGIYTIKITGKIDGCGEDSTKFNLKVQSAAICAQSINDVAIFAVTNSPKTIIVKSPPFYKFLNYFTVSDIFELCSASDIIYNAQITSGNGESIQFLSFDAALLKVSWLSPSVKGVFSVNLTGTITNGNGEKSTSTSSTFVLTVTEDCKTSTEVNISIISSPISSQTVAKQSNGSQVIVQKFSVSGSIYCTATNIVYSVTKQSTTSQSTTFITFDSVTLKISWSSPQAVGVFTVTLTGKITNDNSDISSSQDFILTVLDCSQTTDTVTLTPPHIAEKNVEIFSQPSYITFEQFTVSETSYCSAEDIEYSVEIQADGTQSTQFISFHQDELKIKWNTPRNGGLYTVNVTGTITNQYGNIAAQSLFKLTVTSCSSTSDAFIIIPSQTTNKTVPILSPQSSVELENFQVLGTNLCLESDIVYSATIASDNYQDTSFITFQLSPLKIKWYSPTTAGQYTVTVSGRIQNNYEDVIGTAYFKLTVISCQTSTDEIQIESKQQPQITVLSDSGTGFKLIEPFTLDSIYCSYSDITIELNLLADLNQSTDFITFDPSTQIISWSNPTVPGLYTIKIVGYIMNLYGEVLGSNSVKQVLEVIFAGCRMTDWSTTIVNQYLNYTIGETLQLNISDFVQTGCNIVTTTLYTSIQKVFQILTLTQTNETLGTANLVIFSNDLTLVGTYEVNILCTDSINEQYRNFTITLTIIDKCSYAQLVATQVSDQNFVQTQDFNPDPIIWQAFQSNDVSCKEIEQAVSIIKINGIITADWFTIDTTNLKITFKQQLPKLTIPSIVSVNITGQINAKLIKPQAQIKFYIIVQPDDAIKNQTKNSTKQNKTELAVSYQQGVLKVQQFIPKVPIDQQNTTKVPIPLQLLIDSVSRTGLVKVMFNQPILIPELYQNFTTKRLQPNYTETIQHVIQLNMISGIDIESENRLQISNYNLTDFQQTYMCIKINFTNPYQISQSAQFKDKLEIQVLVREMFLEKQTFKLLPEQNSLISSKIGPQITETDQIKLLKLEDSLDSATQVIAIGNLVINIFLAFSLRYLWNMVNLLQFLVYMQRWNIQMPDHSTAVLKFIKNIALMEFLPTQQITGTISEWFGIDPNDENGIFNSMGLMLVIAFGLILIVIFLFVAQYFVSNDYKWYKRYRLLKQKIFYNAFLRYLLQSCLKLGIGAGTSITIFIASDFNSKDILKALPQIIIMVILISLPLIFSYIINKNKADLQKPSMKAKIGSIYLGIKTDSKSWGELLSSSIFVVRRIVFLLVTFLLPSQPCQQIQFWINVSIYYISYLMIFQPYDTKFAIQIEFVNEILFMLVNYHFILLTDVVQDQTTREFLGWSLIVIIGAILILNLSVIVYVNFSHVYRKLKLKRLRANAQKQHKLQMQAKQQQEIAQSNEQLQDNEDKQILQPQQSKSQIQQNHPIVDNQLTFGSNIEILNTVQQSNAGKSKLVNIKEKPKNKLFKNNQVIKQGITLQTYPQHMIEEYDRKRDEILKEFDRDVERDFQAMKQRQMANRKTQRQH